MVHNLEIRDGQASLIFTGEPPWHGLGTRLKRPATAQEALQAASLDLGGHEGPPVCRARL
jgi:hypothetical protein